MTNVNALLEKALSLGATFACGEHGLVKVRAPAPLPVEFIEELKKHKPEIIDLLRKRGACVITHDHLAPSGSTEENVVSAFFNEDERHRWLVLVLKRPEKYPQGPITIDPGLRIMDIAKFTQATIQDLVTYVMAKNRGSSHWVDRVLDEKLELLKLCGVKAEIRRLH